VKIIRLPVLETANMLVWLGLLAHQLTVGIIDGLATFYLPVSLTLLLIWQLKRTRPAFDVSVLFLISSLLFFCVGIILSPFSSTSLTEFYSIVVIDFTWPQLDFAAILIGLSISITMTTMMFFRINTKRYFQHKNTEDLKLNSIRYKELYKIGVLLTIISLPAITFGSIEQLRLIKDAGYLALYTGDASYSDTSKVFFYIYDLGFGLIVAFSATKSQFLKPALLYLVIATIDSLKGARGALLVPLLFIGWFYVARFNISVKLRTVLYNFCIIIIIFATMTFLRDSDALNSGVLQFILDALASQGRSLQIAALYQTVAGEVAKYGNYTVLSNLLMPINAVIHPEIRAGYQSMDLVLYSNSLKNILTYVLNDNYYFSGGGTGGVYTIELIESGPIFYVLLSMLLGWFFVWMPVAMSKPWVRYLSVYFFSTVFYLPRGEFFFNTLIVGKAFFLYLFVMVLYALYERSKKPKCGSREISLLNQRVGS
jgi:hypothetical protein